MNFRFPVSNNVLQKTFWKFYLNRILFVNFLLIHRQFNFEIYVPTLLYKIFYNNTFSRVNLEVLESLVGPLINKSSNLDMLKVSYQSNSLESCHDILINELIFEVLICIIYISIIIVDILTEPFHVSNFLFFLPYRVRSPKESLL